MMLRKLAIYSLITCASLCCSSLKAQSLPADSIGVTTEDQSKQAFNHSVANITDPVEQLMQDNGQTGFLRDFGKVKIRGKIRLGPQFNARSCAQCHSGNGRGVGRLSYRAPFSDTVIKVSQDSGKALNPGAPIPLEKVGSQISDHAVKPAIPVGRGSVKWVEFRGQYSDGSFFSLRAPDLHVTLNNGALPKGARLSIRRAPPIFGSGLLEAIREDEILALADPQDLNSDGISGKVNVVWDMAEHANRIGRFGFKAGHPSLKQQIAAAYATDMGISNPIFKSKGLPPEISTSILNATTFFTATRAVPRSRNQDEPTIVAGRIKFTEIGCADCHTIELHTSAQHPIAALADKTIYPFSDLLLHDMGPGLSDNHSEFSAAGNEWRTTPLWGIGLTSTILNGVSDNYLHDGRARTLEEAILWHAGEAEQSRTKFMNSSSSERDALIQFLRSL